jgi:CubicO group peptidase (beta-lactamase class C family)
LSGIIRHATGRFVDDYAREHLFAPLGIEDVHWKKTPTGHPDTEGGLYLSAEALGRIGELYLRDGDYGFQWWITAYDGVDVWAGRGFGGQLLLIVPSRETVAVVLAWNVFGTPARNITRPLIEALIAEP